MVGDWSDVDDEALERVVSKYGEGAGWEFIAACLESLGFQHDAKQCHGRWNAINRKKKQDALKSGGSSSTAEQHPHQTAEVANQVQNDAALVPHRACSNRALAPTRHLS